MALLSTLMMAPRRRSTCTWMTVSCACVSVRADWLCWEVIAADYRAVRPDLTNTNLIPDGKCLPVFAW